MKLVVLTSCFAVLAIGQQSSSFEVAEVKVNKSIGPLSAQFLPSGQVYLRNITMRLMIMSAWGVRDYAVSGGPDWIDSDRFDVAAKAAPHTSIENFRPMLQALLVERFKLAVHREQQVRSVYDLMVAKTGPKLTASPPESTEPVGCTGGRENGLAVRKCRGISMTSFTQVLSVVAPHYIDLPVINATGLPGLYDFTLTWTPNQSIGKQGGMTIFAAVESQLGLKLERRKEPVSLVVVDRVERFPVP
jgi:uncharacterized protein (TIGR03435 family)